MIDPDPQIQSCAKVVQRTFLIWECSLVQSLGRSAKNWACAIVLRGGCGAPSACVTQHVDIKTVAGNCMAPHDTHDAVAQQPSSEDLKGFQTAACATLAEWTNVHTQGHTASRAGREPRGNGNAARQRTGMDTRCTPALQRGCTHVSKVHNGLHHANDEQRNAFRGQVRDRRSRPTNPPAGARPVARTAAAATAGHGCTIAHATQRQVSP